MNTTRHTITALMVAGVLLLGAGCAQQVGDIDRTNPDKVNKDLFQGEWYIRHTVTDVPPSTGFTVAGFMTQPERIRWEIQKSFLIARRVHENIDGVHDGRANEWRQDSEGNLEREFEGSIIAAYRIQSHFDIQRSYSTATGEQSNVIVENGADRNWNETQHMRVDWSQNLASEVALPGMTLFREQFAFAPVSYFVSEVETDNPDRPLLTKDYMELTNKWSMRTRDFCEITAYGCIPYCWISDTGDCAEEVIKVKTSIMKRTADREMHEPRIYDDVSNKKFQIFRTERIEHADGYGSPYPARRQYANIYNIWDDAHKPVAERNIRPIKYYLSANFPREDPAVMWAVRKAIADWNVVFEDMAAESGYPVKDDDQFVVLCEDNPVVSTTPEICATHTTYDKDADGNFVRRDQDVIDITRQGYVPMGDMRFSMIQMIRTTSGFGGVLGFAQFSNDKETGETLSSTTTMLYPNQEWAITRQVDWLQLLNGDLPLEEWISGKYIEDAILENRTIIHPDEAISAARQEIKPRRPLVELDAINAIRPKYADFKQRLADYDLDEVRLRHKRNIDDLRDRGGPAIYEARRQTLAESIGVQHDVLLRETAKQDLAGLPAEFRQVNEDKLDMMTVLGASPEERRLEAEGFQKWLASNNILHADAITGVGTIPMFAPLAKRFKGASREEIFNYIRPQYWYFVFAHEVGHDLGLEHNFAATTDSINFSENYWLEKARLGYMPEYLVDEDVWEEKYQDNISLRASQFTTLMDYVPYEISRDIFTDGNQHKTGLGTADRAAIYYAYGKMVQVFDENEVPDNFTWTDNDGNEYDINVNADEVNFDPQISDKVNEYHYTYYPNFAYADAAEPRVAVSVDGGLGYDGINIDGELLDETNMAEKQDVLFTAAIALIKGRRWVKEEQVAEESLNEVPYRTCNNYLDGSLEWCNLHDFGVDMWERVHNDIAYSNFGYYSNFFRRTYNHLYTGLYYAWNATIREFAFKTNQHKHWINRALIEDRPFHEFWYADETGGLDGLFASMDVLEFFQKYMAAPSMPDKGYRVAMVREDGELIELPDDSVIGASQPVLEKARYYFNRNDNVFEPMDQYNEDELDRRMYLDFDLGDARYLRSEYDPDLGFNYFWRPVRYGNWISKFVAVQMAADPYTNIVGADTGADASYALNLGTLFQREIFKTIAGYITEDTDMYGNSIYFEDGKPVFNGILSAYDQLLPSPFTTHRSDAMIRPDESFSAQVNALIVTSYLFDLSYNNPFAEALNVQIKGEDRAIPEDMVEGVDYLVVKDLRSANEYVVFKHNRESGFFNIDDLEAPTWEMALKIRDIYTRYDFDDMSSFEDAKASAASMGVGQDERREIEREYDDARRDVEAHLENFDILRGLFFNIGFRYPI